MKLAVVHAPWLVWTSQPTAALPYPGSGALLYFLLSFRSEPTNAMMMIRKITTQTHMSHHRRYRILGGGALFYVAVVNAGGVERQHRVALPRAGRLVIDRPCSGRSWGQSRRPRRLDLQVRVDQPGSGHAVARRERAA